MGATQPSASQSKSSSNNDVTATENNVNMTPAKLIHSGDCLLFGLDMIGKSRVDKVVSAYVLDLFRTNTIDKHVPPDIVKLCLLFYQTTTWTVHPTTSVRNATYGKQSKRFGISSLHTNLFNDCYIQAQFEYGPYVCCLHITPRKLSRCKKNRSKTLDDSIYMMETKKFGFGQSPIVKQYVTFDLYFQIVPRFKSKMTSLPINTRYKYKWKLNEMTAEKISKVKDQCWCSPNFYNEGCFCLGLKSDCTFSEYNDDNVSLMKLYVQMHLLRHPIGSDDVLNVVTSYTIYGVDGTSYSSELCKGELMFRYHPHVAIAMLIPCTSVIDLIECAFYFE
eukprot:481582_1